MGEERKRITKLPTEAAAGKALKWIRVSYEGGNEVADELVGTDTWASQLPDHGLLEVTELLAETLRRLRNIESYCLGDKDAPRLQWENDVFAMATRGQWGRAAE
ncbi:hypothetical protein SEA_DATBOI_104 [Gordonia phage DatBoi]|nr:hypothetical protein SEA_DATBOI_104 [Gordonia phage DatBoi]